MVRGKIISYLLSLALVLSLNFLVVECLPGDPLVHLIGEDAYGQLQGRDPHALEELRAQYGLDQTLGKRYLTSLANTLGFRWGWSFQYGQPVAGIILYRLKWTLLLLAPAVALAALLGLALGSLAARPGAPWFNRAITTVSLIVYSTPAYCLAFLFLLALAFSIDSLPLGGMVAESAESSFGDIARHMAVPFSVLVLHNTAYLTVIMQSAVRQVFGEEFVLTARAKGLSSRQIMVRHVIPNAMPTYLTAVAINTGFIAGGALLVEVVFSWQGMGSLMFGAVAARDYPVLSGCFLVVALAVLAANIAADILSAIIDPRVRDNNAQD